MRHWTERVAWHDRAWDGAVCDHPDQNAFCLCLDRVRGERDDVYEIGVAGRHWSTLTGDLPPCAREAGAFMSAREWIRRLEHPYQGLTKTQDTHGHLKSTPVKVPPFATFAVPFAWMMRGNLERIADI